ncbi:MAG: rod shape-determining protein MreC [Candidatus Lambdaproteobacteria bacterium]|nr:rod shape-determining protein MreC [Candidatus Lambdaproteobacteria bacterium]
MLELIRRNRMLFSAAGVLLLLVLLLSLRWSNPGNARFIDESVYAIAYPFQSAYHRVTASFRSVFEHYVALVHLKEENDRLTLRVRALEEELNHHVNSAIQFDVLREQLGFLEENPERKVFAEVIGESASSLYQLLLINKGLLAGIRRNYPVVLREGVVGRIQSATAMSAVVELITDRRHRFPVMIQRSRDQLETAGEGGSLRLVVQDRGVVFGLGDELRMNRIRMLADVQPGDRVVTSGLAGIFPKGLLVGTVASVTRERHELFQSAEIRPAVNFRKIEGVFVIIRDAKDINSPLFTDQ